MKSEFPIATDGLRVGILGGSFDPPHNGHVHISKWALKEFGLDFVWWLVSPGNPLKLEGPADLDRRMQASSELVSHPRIVITDLERKFGTRYTAETLEALQAHYSTVRFVWLMGADNLAEFHKWDRWQNIMKKVPIGVMARPDQQLAAGCSPAARMFRRKRLSSRRSIALPFQQAPCWSLITGPMVAMSSTQIRASGKWVR